MRAGDEVRSQRRYIVASNQSAVPEKKFAFHDEPSEYPFPAQDGWLFGLSVRNAWLSSKGGGLMLVSWARTTAENEANLPMILHSLLDAVDAKRQLTYFASFKHGKLGSRCPVMNGRC